MERARMANVARAKETFCFQSKLLSLKLFARLKHGSQRPRRDGFDISETQKSRNSPRWLKISPCSWFSCGGTRLSRGALSESRLPERIPRSTWLWCWLFSDRLTPNGVERKTLSCSRPVDGINPSYLHPPSPTHSQLFQTANRRSPNTEVASQADPWGNWWRALSPVNDGPDLSIVQEEQPSSRVVCRVIIPN